MINLSLYSHKVVLLSAYVLGVQSDRPQRLGRCCRRLPKRDGIWDFVAEFRLFVGGSKLVIRLKQGQRALFPALFLVWLVEPSARLSTATACILDSSALLTFCSGKLCRRWIPEIHLPHLSVFQANEVGCDGIH